MSETASHEHVVSAAAAKAAPPVGVSVATIAGVPMSDIVLWMTAIYLVLQIAYLLWKWVRDREVAERDDQEHAERRRRDRGRDPDRRHRGNIRLPVAVLTLSAAGFVGLLVHEGYTDKAVIPVAGDVPTVGFGTTSRPDGTPVRMGDRTTPVDAAGRALRDVQRFEGALRQCVRVPLTQAEYDVYASHAYNIGPDAFCKSTIVRRLNAGDYRGACEAILMWRFVAGRDCSASGSGCAGVWTRMVESHQKCLAAQP